MKSQQFIELNSNLFKFLENLNEEISSYESQYQFVKQTINENNYNTYQQKKKSAETKFDQFDEIIQRNRYIISMEEKMINIMTTFMSESTRYFSSVKNEKEELEKKYNDIIDEMKEENKKKNKNINEMKYNIEKNDIKKLYIQTKEIKQRMNEKERKNDVKRKPNEERVKIEKVMNQLIVKNQKQINQNSFFTKAKKEFDCILKLLFVGESSGGKTSLLHKVVEDKFDEQTRATIGVGVGKKIIESYGKNVSLQLVCLFMFQFNFFQIVF